MERIDALRVEVRVTVSGMHSEQSLDVQRRDNWKKDREGQMPMTRAVDTRKTFTAAGKGDGGRSIVRGVRMRRTYASNGPSLALPQA
mgnify:CR=1 FL=1